jgi:predicted  nucleic acid-binding Zn-ribbon protein
MSDINKNTEETVSAVESLQAQINILRNEVDTLEERIEKAEDQLATIEQ